MMTILTFDIEEWYLEKKFFGNHTEKYAEFDRYLDHILAALDLRGIKATFFCVGGMAAEFPEVVRRIKAGGHEIGCHSYQHVWLYKMSREEVLEDTYRAINALEQCIGVKVKSYRAPAFSIGENNMWVLEILSKCGIERDSSFFPAERDFGGFPQFGQNVPTMTFFNRIMMKEFPICTTKILDKEIAYSGGGYFRFFPLSFVKSRMKQSDYAMTYFHIADLIPESDGLMNKEDFESYFKVPGTLKNRSVRYLKSNLGKKKTFGKLMELIRSEEFVNLEQADEMMDWNRCPAVVLT